MSNRLLLADEDPRTLRVLEASLRSAGFEVTSVTTGAAAWVSIDGELPQVILAATNLAALDGFELCTRVRARPGGRDVAFLLLGDDDSLALRVKTIEAGADDYLLKPPDAEDVLARIRALVERRDRETFASSTRAAEAFAGQVADLRVVDLLQVLADARRSGIVHLRGAREAPATIYFRQGQVVDAEVGRLSGVNAISRLFSWVEGSFEVHWKPIRRPDAIGLSTPDLIVEGMKRLDERNQLAGALPELNSVFEVNYRVLAERLSEIPDEVNAVLRLFDGARTLAHVVEDCQLPDREAIAIAIRLRDEGIIHDVSRSGGAENPGALVVPPRPAGRAPGADDVTVVRRITSLGDGSGPVQQAFSSPETRALEGAASAETVVGPIPVAPSSFDEVDGVVPPANHAKTDPGLGQPLELPDPDDAGRSSEYALAEGDALPSARTAGGGAAAELTASSAAATSARPEAQSPVTDRAPALASEMPSESAAERVGLDADPSSLQTQRGLGPFPELFAAQSGSTRVDAVSLDAASLDPDDAQATRPIDLEYASDPDGQAPGARAPDHLVQSSQAQAPPSDREPVRARSSGGEKTMPVTVVEDELSAQEALDELGVPARGRGLKIVAALAVAGALAAVMVYKLRPGGTASSSPPAASERLAGQSPGPSAPPPPVAPGAADNRPAAAPQPSARNAAAEGTPDVAAPEAAMPGTAPAQPAKLGTEPAATSGETAAAPGGAARPEIAAPANGAAASEKSVGDSRADRAAAEKSLGDPAPGNAAPSGRSVADSAAGNGALARKSVGEPAGKVARADRAVPEASAGPVAPAPGADFAHQLATCRSQFLHDRIREAATTCAAALEANPKSADALTMMAHVELNRGHLARANDLAQRSLAIDPGQADAYVIMGGVHQDSGRNAQAKVSYRRYLQLAPHGRYADEVRSIVGSL